MKLQKMKWLGTILCGLTFFITSCDKDQESVTSIDQEKVYKKEITSNDFEQILLNNNIRDAVSKQLIDHDTFTIQSTKNRDNLVIRIKKGAITQLNTSDNLTTYSIHVDVSDNDSRKHYYKLILITQSGKSTYKLLKFIPENNVTLTTGQFKGVVENIELNENSTMTSKECVDTYFVYEIFMPCINHPGQYEPNASLNCDGGHWETRVGTIRCSGGGGGTGGSTSGSGNSWTGGGSTGTPINYLGNYPIDEDPYPVPTPEEVFTNFKVGLSQEAYNFLLKNPALESQIKEYLLANLDYQNNFSTEAEAFAKQLLNFAMVNHITFTFNNLDPKNFKSFNNFQELQSFLDSENIDLQDNTETNDVTDIGPDKKISRRKIGLTPTHDLAVELVFTPMPNFELDNSQSTVELSSMITIPGYDWKQKAMIVSNSNWSSTEAEITITGYILYGIKVGDFELGIPKYKEIKLAMDKKNGKICCTSVKNIE